MNNACDGITDQVGHGMIQESEKIIPPLLGSQLSVGGVKQSCYVLTLRKINSLAFREFNYSL